MASRSGFTVIVVIGLVALGSAGDQGCDPPPGTTGDEATDAGEFGADEDFSFEPAPGATTTGDDGDGGTGDGEGDDGGEGDDFSFEPEAGATASEDEDEDGDQGDGDGSDEGDGDGDADGADGGGDLSTCNDVVVASSSAGEVPVPGDDRVFSETTLDCTLAPGDDDEAVSALQDALAQCNGQDVGVDGDYGDQTSRAVMAVEQEHGLAADGTYDLATALAMRWPAGGDCAPLGSAGG